MKIHEMELLSCVKESNFDDWRAYYTNGKKNKDKKDHYHTITKYVHRKYFYHLRCTEYNYFIFIPKP